jgi:drug/metabolite transporter (DMT)-like permease
MSRATAAEGVSYALRMVRPARVVRAGLWLEAVPAPRLALAGLVLLNLMWGGSLPATKLALLSFGPFSLAAARLILASALFLLVLGPNALRAVSVGDALRMAGLGVIGFTGVQVFQAVGTGQTSGATATVLASTSPLWIALLAPILLGENLRLAAVLGVLLALLGVAAITGLGPGQATGVSGAPIGNLIVLLSSVSSALYTVLGKGLARRYSPLMLCGISCLGGALASLPLAAWELSADAASPTVLAWALLAYLGVLVTFVGFAVWFWGLRALPAAQAGALIFLQPLSGLVLAILVLGDRPTPSFLVGCVLVLAGVYLAVGARPSIRVVVAASVKWVTRSSKRSSRSRTTGSTTAP